mgnify:FL=1
MLKYKSNNSLAICHDIVIKNQNEVTASENEVYNKEQEILDNYIETKQDIIPAPLHQEYQVAYQKLQEKKRLLEWSTFHLEYLEQKLNNISPRMAGFKDKYRKYKELRKMVAEECSGALEHHINS